MRHTVCMNCTAHNTKEHTMVTSTAPLTNSPIRLSDVDIDTSAFERAHGKQPRGEGSWGFVSYAHSRSADYYMHVQWFSGSYGVVKRAAAKAFAAQGIMDVVVCS